MRSTFLVTCCLLVCGIFLALPAAPAGAEDRNLILLESGFFDPAQPQALEEGLAIAEGEAGSEVLLVKLSGPASVEQQRALGAVVERVYAYLPHDTFLVRTKSLGAVERGRVARAVEASWLGTYQPAYKISRRLAAITADGVAVGAEGTLGDEKSTAHRLPVMVRVFPDGDLATVTRRLMDLGAGTPVGSAAGERFGRLRFLLTAQQIVDLRWAMARLPEVFHLDLEGRRVLLNDTTSWVAQSGVSGGAATPVHDQGIFGAGQTVAVLDTGIDPDMCFFRDDAAGLPAINPCDGGTAIDGSQRKVIAVNFLWSSECAGGISAFEWDTHDHGTHVAGTVAGDNPATPGVRDAGDGLAPAARLVIQDGGVFFDNCADLPGLGCPVVDLNPIFQQTYDQGARIHTNSWGDRENFTPHNIYSAGSEDADEFMWEHPEFLLVFAAGNSGPSSETVGSPATGKNVVAVGATRRGSSAESLASFSSCGPTDDGRIKPDVTMPGESIISANNDSNTGTNNCNTRSMSGTSMAAPGVAGAAALVREYYTGGWYPSGSAQLGDAFTPSAALLKGSLVHSAQAMTSVGQSIPADCQGWGRVLLDNVLYFAGEDRDLWIEDDTSGPASVGPDQTRRSAFQVSPGESLKVTLTWTDYPSTPVAAVHLVNDLDLLVSGPSGTFRGNVFAGGASGTGGTFNHRDTVEQVYLPAPAAGEYTVTVDAFNLPQGPQPYALVVSGDLTALPDASLFSDDFEGGNAGAWSAVVSDQN
ncbi:MAG: S8 family serine peptidase [Acidobacteriota bacterium]|nr:S8 family serine peptidase [Acidobacteriota bacterium]